MSFSAGPQVLMAPLSTLGPAFFLWDYRDRAGSTIPNTGAAPGFDHTVTGSLASEYLAETFLPAYSFPTHDIDMAGPITLVWRMNRGPEAGTSNWFFIVYLGDIMDTSKPGTEWFVASRRLGVGLHEWEAYMAHYGRLPSNPVGPAGSLIESEEISQSATTQTIAFTVDVTAQTWQWVIATDSDSQIVNVPMGSSNGFDWDPAGYGTATNTPAAPWLYWTGTTSATPFSRVSMHQGRPSPNDIAAIHADF